MSKSPTTPEQRTALTQQIAEDIAGEMMCPDMPPCCDDCACWKEAVNDVDR